jgi:hypothetical protein
MKRLSEMTDKIETVRIVASDPEQGNYVIINKDDFDKKTMKEYDGPDNPEPVKLDGPQSFEAMAAELARLKAIVEGGSPEGAEGWGNPPAE